MPDLISQLTEHTGLSPELVQKGLGALFGFLKKELGEETFSKVESSIPEASALRSQHESAPEPEEAAPAQRGLLDVVTGLAGKLLGGKAGEGVDLLSTFAKLGFKPEQVEAFLPKALELIKTYLSPELIQKLLASLPAIAKMLASGAKQEA
jgi:Protein of unknown function VcgC/VcgE (DUF2780)